MKVAVKNLMQSTTLKMSGLVTLGVFFALLLLEFLVRIIPEAQPSTDFPERPHVYYLPPHAISARGNEFNVKKQPDVKRISIVGDSFTFGPKMQFYDTFPARLEKMMNLNTASKKIEVVNYGTPGYSTRDELALIRQAVDAESDLVILQITLNDAQEMPLKYNPLVSHENKSGILSNSKLYRMVQARVETLRSKQKYIDYHKQLFEEPKTFKLFTDSITEMKAIADRKETPLVAILFPLFDFPIDETYPFADLHAKIMNILKANNIPALDLAKAYRNIDIKRLQLEPGKDTHANEIGHRIAAEAIFKWLKSRHNLPDEIFEIRSYYARDGVFEKHVTSNKQKKENNEEDN